MQPRLRLEEEYRKCRTENPPRQDENSEQPKYGRKKEVEISNIKVEILPAWESAKNLGQQFTFQHQETAEIKNRIRAAWASENASPHHPDKEEIQKENADQQELGKWRRGKSKPQRLR